MVTRIISALVGLVLFFIIMFSKTAVISVALFIIAIIALYEVYNAFHYNKYVVLWIAGLLSCIIFVYGDHFNSLYMTSFLFILILLFVMMILLRHEEITSKDIATMMFFTLLIPFIFSTIGYIKRMPNGQYYVWVPFVIAWITDSAAYFVGKFMGKHKLCEKISPKKTIEGSIGGILGAIIGLVIYGLIMQYGFMLKINYGSIVIIATIGSVLAQMGDLFASCIKRENNIKDFGKIMPGHGGVLDRFDSLLLTLPFVYLYVGFFNIFL